jgi:signal transduction histidine kinase/ActR/RegA family two-component response regulator
MTGSAPSILKPRWIIVAAVALAALLFAADMIAAGYGDRRLRDQAACEAQVEADLVARSLASDGRADDAPRFLDVLRANPEVQAAGFYSPAGVLLSGFRRNASQNLPAHPPPSARFFVGDQAVATALVGRGGSAMGLVYLSLRSEPPALRSMRYAALGLLSLMAMLVAAILAGANAAQRSANRALGQANDSLRQQIEQREQAEAALRQSQKMEAMGQLTRGVAHDFNNLLMVLSGGLDLLDRPQSPKRIDQLKQGMRQAVDRGATLTRQLLDFSRHTPLKTEVVDLGRRIEAMSLLLERSLREDITVRYDIPPGLWPVELDPAQLEMALLNIAVNARDAMPNGGVVTFAAHNRPAITVEGKKGDFVELSVTDTGEGMAPETVQRAFEPFFTTKVMRKGTGLGLSQVYGFSHASGGATLISSAPGQGATITLYFPASAKPLSPQAPAFEPTSAAAPPGTVLLVEDEDAVAQAVSAMLGELGYRVVREADAMSALAVLDRGEEPIDLVFSDMIMPGPMDGAALAETLTQKRPGLPVVLTTGFSEAAKEAVRKGLTVLPKPYRLEELASSLAAVRMAKRKA